MTSAFAPAGLANSASPEKGVLAGLAGAQTLLALKSARQNYFAEAAAVAVYALIIAAALSYQAKPVVAPPEEPLELVMEAPPPPVEEPKPPEPQAVTPPEPQVEEPPPPPVAEQAVAPIEPPKPKPIPKPVVKRIPKPVEKVERPAPEHRAAVIAAPVRVAPAPAGATPSAIANQIHARLMRAAANSYPESQKPRSARISYRVSIDASGHVTSFSITPSGNAAFDSFASRLGGRIGTVDAPGRAASLSGVINFAYQ